MEPGAVWPLQHQGRHFPEGSILCPENLHLVSIQPSGQQGKEKLQAGWTQARRLGEGVTGGASPSESPLKDVKLGRQVRPGLRCQGAFNPRKSHSSSPGPVPKQARANCC